MKQLNRQISRALEWLNSPQGLNDSELIMTQKLYGGTSCTREEFNILLETFNDGVITTTCDNEKIKCEGKLIAFTDKKSITILVKITDLISNI